MIDFDRIVSAVDFSANSERALDFAILLAKDFGAGLIVMHVTEPAPSLPVSSTDAEQITLGLPPADVGPDLDRLVDRARAQGVSAEWRFVAGVPHREIVRCSNEWSADIIVMGTMGRTGLAHVVMGSTAERVVRKASCPVLTVRMAEHSSGRL